MENELREFLESSDALAIYPNVTPEQLNEIAVELANRVFMLAVEIAPDVIESVLGTPPADENELPIGQCELCENDAEWVLVVSYPASDRYRSAPCCDDCAEVISHRENVIDGQRFE